VADAPWRCSQCGTVNEPVANSCRTCGRWPSLFDLESSKVDTGAPLTYDEADEFAAQTVEVEYAEPEVYDPVSPGDAPPPRMEDEFEDEAVEEDEAEPKPVWQRLASLIVPIGVVAYIILSALADR
jgi:hypothetical protein